MSEVYTDQTLGYLQESTYGTDPISTNSTTYYQFGKYNMSWGDLPSENRQIFPVFTGAQRYPATIGLAKYNAMAQILFADTWGQPLYLAMGKTTNSGASDPFTHDLEFLAQSGSMNSLTMRDEDSNSSSIASYYSSVGSYIQRYQTSFDFRQASNFLTSGITIMGQQMATPQFAGAHSNGPTLPVGDLYTMNNGTPVLNWGGTFSSGKYSSGGTSLVDDLVDIAFIIDTQMLPDIPQGQKYPAGYVIGRQIMTCNLSYLRKTDDVIFDDFITMQDGSTTKNLAFKIYQDSSHYRYYHLSDCVIHSIRRNNTVNTEELAVYDITMQAQRVIVEVVDSLSGATYYA